MVKSAKSHESIILIASNNPIVALFRFPNNSSESSGILTNAREALALRNKEARRTRKISSTTSTTSASSTTGTKYY